MGTDVNDDFEYVGESLRHQTPSGSATEVG